MPSLTWISVIVGFAILVLVIVMRSPSSTRGSLWPSTVSRMFRWIDAYLTLAHRDAHITQFVDDLFGCSILAQSHMLAGAFCGAVGALAVKKQSCKQGHAATQLLRPCMGPALVN